MLKRFVSEDPIGLAGRANVHAYVGATPTMHRDALGLWSTEAHNYFINNALGNLPYFDRLQVMHGSAIADAFQYQTAQYSYMHAMSSSVWSKEQARGKFCEFIDMQMDAFNRDRSSNIPSLRRKAYQHLGMAMHAVTDATSPAHGGFQEWPGESPAHLHGPRWPNKNSIEDIDTAPGYLDVTRAKMLAVFNGGKLLECLCR